MSTHFYPRPPPTPSSPVRPSTAHSTIRAVTPSPPASDRDSFKTKSEHVLSPAEMATYARYLKLSEHRGPNQSSDLRGEGAMSGRSNPVKSNSKSLKKDLSSTPSGMSARAEMLIVGRGQDGREIVAEQNLLRERAPASEQVLEGDDRPYTPTPVTRVRKRQAYAPRYHRPASAPLDDLSFLPPGPPALRPSPVPRLFSGAQVLPRRPLNTASPPTKRMSVSGASQTTFLSTASRNSIFSTPGRDELERKKALVELDEGPFAKVQSMMDLNVERRRVSGARMNWEKQAGKSEKKGGCGCVVM